MSLQPLWVWPKTVGHLLEFPAGCDVACEPLWMAFKAFKYACHEVVTGSGTAYPTCQLCTVSTL